MTFLAELDQAFTNDDFEAFKQIVDGLKEIDAIDEEWEQTAFVMINDQIRADTDKFKYPLYLIDKGANLNQTCGSMSPLLNAAKNGSVEWMKILIERGADVNYFDNNYPPILAAIWGDQPESLRFLLSQSSIDLEVAKQAAYGDSLMTFAKNKKAKKCIELLKELKIK